METIQRDVTIVGAGPAGAACALMLSRSGLSVAVLDKADFPRDKICGDALSVDVVNQLEKISPKLAEDFHSLSEKVPSYGVTIYAPSTKALHIPFVHKQRYKCGYLCERSVFDNLLVSHMKQAENVTFFPKQKVAQMERSESGVTVRTQDRLFSSSMVLGADGAQSVVARSLRKSGIDRRYYSAGLRMYYDNVGGFSEGNYIELFFFKKIRPGYLWVFPLPDGKANVGIGVLSSAVTRRSLNLREILSDLLATHPVLRDRFKDAIAMESPQGFGLPLGGKKRRISGDRFLLLGDAAGLIDPFSGEGIANAIRSGRFAADHVLKCFSENNFSPAFNRRYDAEIYRLMQKEFRISRTLQKMCSHPWLFNKVVRNANRNEHLKGFLTGTLSDIEQKKLLARPGFYCRLFFG